MFMSNLHIRSEHDIFVLAESKKVNSGKRGFCDLWSSHKTYQTTLTRAITLNSVMKYVLLYAASPKHDEG